MGISDVYNIMKCDSLQGEPSNLPEFSGVMQTMPEIHLYISITSVLCYGSSVFMNINTHKRHREE